MSEQTPYELLGVSANASFDEIQEARNRLMATVETEDEKKVEAIESAYDAVLMHRLKMRQEGKIKVPERIRFPERSAPPAPLAEQSKVASKLPSWMQDLADQPEPRDILLPAGITLALVGIAMFALDSTADPSVLQLLLVAGWGAAVYFFNRKEGRFGRAVLVTFLALLGGLITGTALGIALQPSLLAAAQLSVDQFSAIVTLVVLWAVSSFLK